jgi:hypothetical protein
VREAAYARIRAETNISLFSIVWGASLQKAELFKWRLKVEP